jgi:copper(I)-binding protein
MLIGLNKDLGVGDSGKIALTFKTTGIVELPISVQTPENN